MGSSHSFSVTLTILLYWSTIESGLALIASCLPTLYQQVSGNVPFQAYCESVTSLTKRLLKSINPRSKGSQDHPYSLTVATGSNRFRQAQREKAETLNESTSSRLRPFPDTPLDKAQGCSVVSSSES